MFSISVSDFHWMEEVDPAEDLCLHGKAKAIIGDEVLVYDNATVSSTAPRFDARWPPVLETFSMIIFRSSEHSWGSCSSGIFLTSAELFIVSKIFKIKTSRLKNHSYNIKSRSVLQHNESVIFEYSSIF